MLKFATPTILTLCILFTSCASMNSSQKRELSNWQAQNLEVQEKNKTTAALLNILPGIGDFYNGNPGYGIANLLLWPASVLWAPVGGASGADEANYFATKAYVEELESKKKKLKNDVEIAFIGSQISKKDFLVAHKKIDSMGLKEFQQPLEVKDILPGLLDPHEALREPTSTKNK